MDGHTYIYIYIRKAVNQIVMIGGNLNCASRALSLEDKNAKLSAKTTRRLRGYNTRGTPASVGEKDRFAFNIQERREILPAFNYYITTVTLAILL